MWINIPAGFTKLLNSPNATTGISPPSRRTTSRAARIPIPRGKTLGGSSSINGMLYVRGNPLDYNTWAQFGNRGWSYEFGAAVFPQVGTFRAGRRRDPRSRRPAERRPHDRARRTAGCVHRCRRGRGLSAQPGLQQRQAGRLRLLPGHAEERPSAGPPRAASSIRRAAGPTCGSRPRPTPRSVLLEGKRAVGVAYTPARRRRKQARCNGEVIVVGRRGEVAAYPGTVRHRPAGAAAVARHRGEARAARRRRELPRPLRAADELAGEAAGDAERADAAAWPSPRRSSNTTRSGAAS